MNNYIEIRLTNYTTSSKVTARFVDGSCQVRRYTKVTPSSIKRIQNAVIAKVHENALTVRLPVAFDDVGWVANRK